MQKGLVMKRQDLVFFVLCTATVVFTGCQGGASTDPYGLAGKAHVAVTPALQDNPPEWWASRHQGVLDRVAQGNIDLIMVGDSIMHIWERDYPDLWAEYIGSDHVLNLGFGADQTQNVLWRLDHGHIDGISPKLAVVMIGTNNSKRNTAEEIADGIKTICAKLRAEIPKTKILLLAIFPRGDSEQRKNKTQNATYNAQWAKIDKASELASVIADNKHIFYLNINEVFLDDNGILTRDVMPDLLHPNEKGYRLWGEAMQPTLKKLMGEE